MGRIEALQGISIEDSKLVNGKNFREKFIQNWIFGSTVEMLSKINIRI
jgi:hypothetical protein